MKLNILIQINISLLKITMISLKTLKAKYVKTKFQHTYIYNKGQLIESSIIQKWGHKTGVS